MKRIFAFLLTMVMVLGMFPATTLHVHAEEPEEEIILEEETLPEDAEEPTEPDTEETTVPEETSAPATEETEPMTTVPETEETEPPTTVPETAETEPEASVPETTETEPATTVPETEEAEPLTTEPELTEPETTVPETEHTIQQREQNTAEYVDGKFAFRIKGGAATLIAYTGKAAKVSIPDSANGYPVRTIGNQAFYNNTTLTSVTIPSTVQNIESGWLEDDPNSAGYLSFGAFAHCENLQTVRISKNAQLHTIGEWTFNECVKLTDINLPSSIRILELSAFKGCKSLTSIVLPEGLETIGQNVFTGTGLKTLHIPASCTDYHWATDPSELASYSVAEGNPRYRTHEGVLYDNLPPTGAYTGWTLINYPKSKPEESYRVPDYCTHIFGDNFAMDCMPEYLNTLYIGNAVAALSGAGHDSFSRLECNIIPDNTNAYYRHQDGLLLSKDGKTLVQVARNFKNTITIPEGVEILVDYLFWYCDELTHITLPASVKVIKDAVFGYCHNLTTITIGNGLTRIGNSAFWWSGIRDVYYAGTEAQWSDISIGGYNESLYAATLHFVKGVSITSQPKSVCVVAGETAKVTVKASGTGLTYTWYYKNPTATKFAKSATTTSAYSVKMSDAVSGRKVYCVVKDKYGNSVKSNTVSLDQVATITTQPKNTCVAKGSTAKVTVKAVGKGLTYQWYYKNPTATKFSKSSTTSASYSVKMSNAVSGRQVYCVIKDSYGNSVKTKTVSLDQEVTITTQPKNTCVAKGSTAKVTVKAVGKGLTYQWYYKNPTATKFSKSSTTSASYSVKMSNAVSGRQVYCVIKDSYGNSVKTKTVSLDQKATITTQPKNTCVAKGSTAKVTVKAVGKGLTYTWYYKNPTATKFAKSSTTTGSYSVKMSNAVSGRQVYCVIKDSYGNSVKTKTVSLDQKVTIITQPKGTSVRETETARVTVEAIGKGLTYKWYYKNPGLESKFVLATNMTGKTFAMPMVAQHSGRQVYCVITDAYGNSVKSNTVTLTVIF